MKDAIAGAQPIGTSDPRILDAIHAARSSPVPASPTPSTPTKP